MGAKRCVSVSPADDRCACHEPLYRIMGTRCAQQLALKATCYEVSKCQATSIKTACQVFHDEVNQTYTTVVAVVSGLLVLIGLTWLFASGFFDRLGRAKLGLKTEARLSLRKQVEEPSFTEMIA
jgi:hypothetical protein